MWIKFSSYAFSPYTHSHKSWTSDTQGFGITAYCSVNLKHSTTKIYQLPDVNDPFPGLSYSSSPLLERAPYSTAGQVIKKLFVVLDWIDHLFPEFLFLSFTHYTPPPDGRGHLFASAFIALANRNILQHFLGVLSFIYWDKRLKFSKGKKIKISLRLTAMKMRVCVCTGRLFELQVYKAIY